jgi:hypothetical protein
MSNSKEFIATNSVQFVNDTNKNLLGGVTLDSSGQIVFTDEFTRNTYKFDQPDTKIANLTLKDLADFPQGITVDDLGQISFQDTKSSAYLSNIVTDIDVVQLLDKLNTIGSIYDFRIQQMSFGDYKYANVKFCTDLASTFGYFSIDKLMNDERARQLAQNEQAAIYQGTAQEALFPPYAGFLRDQDYQVDGWINIDYLVHLALANNFGYDDAASFSLRTKPFQDAKRVIIMMVLNYVNDMFSLGSFNKLSDFGVRIVDRNTDQEIDLAHVQTNLIGQIGSNIMATYVGPLKYELSRTYDTTVPHVKSLDVNQCDKKYINKCDGVIFTLKDEPEKEDAGCPVCYRHEIGVEIRVNPHADTRINKPDIQNTIDPIHWTAGLVTETTSASGDRTTDTKNINYDLFKNLVDEFGEKTYTVGKLNESRAFAAGAGDYQLGLIAGGFAHDADQPTRQVTSTETWNGTSWAVVQGGNMPVGRSLGLMGGGYKQAVYAFGATYADTLHAETETIIWNGASWFTASPYTISQPNVARHSAGGKVDVQITLTDENKTPLKSRETFMPHTLFNDNFLMQDADFYKLVAIQKPDEDTNWYALTRFSGFVFGGRKDNSFDLFNVTDANVSNVFEFVSWGDMTRYSYKGGVASVTAAQAGTWMVDPTRNYPVNAYGVCYVGTTVKGLATGGKTGKSPAELLNAYTYPTTFNEFESPILNLAYEYNGITWIRRDNLPEEVYYHAGVGDLENSIYWGGIHGSMEEPHIYDSLETFEDWEVLISRFGGSNHPNGTFGLDGSLRYTLFPTKLDDGTNIWYQVGDPGDYTSAGKPLLGTTAVSGVYSTFSISGVNTNIGNSHTIKISKLINDTTIQSTTYFDGESWKSKVIRAGLTKSKAYGESHEQVGKFDLVNENDSKKTYNGNYIKNPDTTTSDSFVPNGVFAERYNIANSLNPDYSGHTIKGGMWLWSRPTAGENLFHPDNFLTPAGTDVTKHDVVYDYVAHGFTPDIFGPISGDNTLFSFFVDYDSDHMIGLDQFVLGSNANSNELTFVEKWVMPDKFKTYFSNGSIISGHNLLVTNKIIPATSFPYRKTTSYNKFVTPLNDMIATDPVTNTSQLHKFIDMQFRTAETDYDTNVFVYDLSGFTSWIGNTQGTNFHPVAYDGFKQFFTENDGNKVTVSNFVRSSSIRDKATMFPWNDLLGGDATNRAKTGQVTWNWIRELSSDHNQPTYNTFLIVAETIYADVIIPGDYIKPDGTAGYTPTGFWREVFKISKYDRQGKEIWTYEITYDEDETIEANEPAFWINSTFPVVGTLFGTSINNRDLNDGLSTNETYDANGNKILRTINLWNSKTINPINEPIDTVANEQYDMTYINWKKVVDSAVPLTLYSENKLNMIDMLNNEYKIPTTSAISLTTSANAANWFLSMPGATFEGMLIADSKLAFNPAKRYETKADGSFVVYNDTTIPVSGASVGLVKEFISSYSWDVSGVWKVVKTYSASPDSHGYLAKDYGKSTYVLPPVTNNPINANVDPNIVRNLAQYAFPWNYLLVNPAMYVEMVAGDGFWFAYGDATNRTISGAFDTHTNVYHIGHIPVSRYENLKKLPLGKNIYDNIFNIQAHGSSSIYRHGEAILELINTQNGEDLFDMFVTMTEHNEDKPYGSDVSYYPPPVVIIPTPPDESTPPDELAPPVDSPEEPPTYPLEPQLYCCTIDPTGGCVENCGSSGGGGCEIILITGKSIEEGPDTTCLSCYTNGVDTSDLPSWELHTKEEWSVPFMESPFSGPYSADDFNVWVTSAKSDTTRWGTLIFNQVPQYGDLIANFKAHRIGVDPINNKVYLSIITTSISIDNFGDIAAGTIPVPCKVNYDEFVFPTQFATDTLPATGYAALPFIDDILKKSQLFKKGNAVFCTEPSMVYVPEKYGCGISGTPMFYYTEWGTNFIQEFKNKTNAANDTVAHKYYFVHDTGATHGSSTHEPLPDPNSFKIIETDWRRYQDGVGLGGDIPDIDNKNCLPLKQWFIGQTAIGTPSKAVIAGGYKINSGDDTLAPDESASWWHLNTTNKTFKWNKAAINPEDMYNKNYTKRNFSPFFSNGENTFSNSMLSYVMFDMGKNVNVERHGTANFYGKTSSVVVTFDEAIPEVFSSRNMYSISMTPNSNIKIWWSDKTETGFTINCEVGNWIGSVDWSIFYSEDLKKDAVENSLDEQDTYDQFKNL